MPHEEETRHVKAIFEAYAAGDGLKAIAARLDAERVSPPQRARNWNPGTVRKILDVAVYGG